MIGWTIYPDSTETKNNAFGWFQDAAKRQGVELRVLFYNETYPFQNSPFPTLSTLQGCRLSQEDFSEGSLPRFAIMRGYSSETSLFLEQRGVPVFNSTLSMECSRNKITTHRLLEGGALPTPRTFFKEGGEYSFAEVSDYFGAERFVVKPVMGSKGEGVFLVENEEQLREALSYEPNGHLGGAVAGQEPAFEAIELSQGGRTHPCFCQEFIGTSSGFDLRVWVIGEEVAGGVLRYNENSFRSNFAQGGKALPFEVPEEAARLAVAATTCVGLDFAGIDLLFTEEYSPKEGGKYSGGFTICEVNGNAGFRTLSAVNNLRGGSKLPDIPDLLIKRILNKLKY